MDEMTTLFSIEGIGKSNAKFDRAKLLAFNTEAAAGAAPPRLLEAFKQYLDSNPDSPLNGKDDGTLERILTMAGLLYWAGRIVRWMIWGL